MAHFKCYKWIVDVLNEIAYDDLLLPDNIRQKIQRLLQCFHLRRIAMVQNGFIDLSVEVPTFSTDDLVEVNREIDKKITERKFQLEQNNFGEMMEFLQNQSIGDFIRSLQNDVNGVFNENCDQLVKLMDLKNHDIPEEFSNCAQKMFLNCQAMSLKIAVMDYKLKQIFVENNSDFTAFNVLLEKLQNDNKKQNEVYQKFKEKEKVIRQIKEDTELNAMFDKYLLIKKLQLCEKLPK